MSELNEGLTGTSGLDLVTRAARLGIAGALETMSSEGQTASSLQAQERRRVLAQQIRDRYPNIEPRLSDLIPPKTA